jgi:hypothetical protein
MKGHNHRLRHPTTSEARDWQIARAVDYPFPKSGQCSRPRCHELAAMVAEHHFGYGRAGKTGKHEVRVCARHAREFAEEHGLFLEAKKP